MEEMQPYDAAAHLYTQVKSDKVEQCLLAEKWNGLNLDP